MRKKLISKRFLAGVGVLLLAVGMIAAGGAFAKYLSTVKKELTPVTAKTFYFESNYLTEDNHLYKLNAGTKNVSFELYNYENALRVSEMECTYKITVNSTDTTFTINGEQVVEKTVEIKKAVGATEVQKTDTEVVLGNLKDGFEYEVTVKANGGYVKTLSATFAVASAKNGFFMNVENADPSYVILTVWTENVSGDVAVTVPAGLIPDTTDAVLAGIDNYDNDTYDQFEFTDSTSFSSVYSSHSYRFFKTSGYDENASFTVKMGETDAVESKIP